jgi:hypothetical protein
MSSQSDPQPLLGNSHALVITKSWYTRWLNWSNFQNVDSIAPDNEYLQCKNNSLGLLLARIFWARMITRIDIQREEGNIIELEPLRYTQIETGQCNGYIPDNYKTWKLGEFFSSLPRFPTWVLTSMSIQNWILWKQQPFFLSMQKWLRKVRLMASTEPAIS